MSTRVIVMEHEDGQQEDVIFIESIGIPASDFCNPGYHVTVDELISCDMPLGFPMNSTLNRE